MKMKSSKVTLFLYLFALVGLFVHSNAGFTPCTNIPPFVEQMRYGFFADRSTFFGEVEWVNQATNPLFEFTCALNKTWVHMLDPYYRVYQLPDQVYSIEIAFERYLNFTTKIYNDVGPIKAEYGRRSGIDVLENYGVFSRSPSYREYKKLILTQNKTIIENVCKYGAVQVKLNQTSLMMSQKLRAAIARNYNQQTYEDSAFYDQQILEKYGTHFTLQAEFGSYVWQRAVVDVLQLEFTGPEEIETNLIRQIVKLFGNHKMKFNGNEPTATHREPIEAGFLSVNQVKLCLFNAAHKSGCMPGEAESNLEGWKDTLFTNLTLLDAKLTPLEDLFHKDLFMRDNLKKARQLKLAQLYILDGTETIRMDEKLQMDNITRKEMRQLYKRMVNVPLEGDKPITPKEVEEGLERVVNVYANHVLRKYKILIEDLYAITGWCDKETSDQLYYVRSQLTRHTTHRSIVQYTDKAAVFLYRQSATWKKRCDRIQVTRPIKQSNTTNEEANTTTTGQTNTTITGQPSNNQTSNETTTLVSP